MDDTIELAPTKSFFVSLVKDLYNVYIEYQATTETAVRQHLVREYYRDGVWKLPWCSVYDKDPRTKMGLNSQSNLNIVVIQARNCGVLYEWQ